MAYLNKALNGRDPEKPGLHMHGLKLPKEYSHCAYINKERNSYRYIVRR